jgi:hypothetical protein
MQSLAPPLLLLLALPGALAACGEPRPPAVVLQGRQNAETTRQLCERARTWQQQNRARIAADGCDAVPLCREMTPLVERCAADPLAELRAFEDALIARAAAAPACAGVHLARDDAADPPTAPHWRLSLDYQPGEPKQRWRLAADPAPAAAPGGEGDAAEIAAAVCAAVRQR